MSCYVCSKDILVTVLKAWQRYSDGEALRPMASDEEIREAWDELVSANIEAFTERYEGRHLEDIEKDIEKCPVNAISLAQVKVGKKECYDALKEYMYQVSSAENYHHMPGYFKCRWCLDNMLRQYIENEFGDE